MYGFPGYQPDPPEDDEPRPVEIDEHHFAELVKFGLVKLDGYMQKSAAFEAYYQKRPQPQEEEHHGS